MISRTDRQKEGVRKWIKAGCNGTLVWATGTGKTFTALMAIQKVLKAKPNARILISVPTEILQKQWQDEYINKYNLTSNCEVKIINSIVKTSWDVDLLVIDEIHLTPTSTLGEIFNCVDYNMILGLTATIERLDGKEIIVKSFAPVCDEITIKEATSNGWLAPYKEYVVMLDVDMTEYNKWNQEFIGFFSQLGFDFNLAMRLSTNLIERRKYAKKLGVDYKQIDAICFGWMDRLRKRKKFVQSHPHKLEIARKILNARKDKKCIIFASTIKECEQLAKKGELVLHSQRSKKDNSAAIDAFNQLSCGNVFSVRSAKTGLDLKGLSVEIIMNTDSSKISKVQAVGRTIRFEPGKQAEIFTLIIKNSVEEKWLANSTDSSYIVINEQQLEKVLNYEPLELRDRKLIKDVKNRY